MWPLKETVGVMKIYFIALIWCSKNSTVAHKTLLGELECALRAPTSEILHKNKLNEILFFFPVENILDEKLFSPQIQELCASETVSSFSEWVWRIFTSLGKDSISLTESHLILFFSRL